MSSSLSKTNNKIFVLLGPTAVGKTALTTAIFHYFAGFIYADTAALYKELFIGSAKPSSEEQALIPHYLIDKLHFYESFDATRFSAEADGIARGILCDGGVPLLSGGSLFYLRNFLFGSARTPPASETARRHIAQRLETEGAATLYKELKVIDPVSAQRISVNDCYRLTRALEVYYDSGRPLSHFKLPNRLRGDFQFVIIIITREREELYQRINRRVDQMFELGLEEEVRALKAAGATALSPAMKAIGYAEWFNPLYTGHAEIKGAIKQNSRRYAKRQLTFLRGLTTLATIFHADDTPAIETFIEQQLATETTSYSESS